MNKVNICRSESACSQKKRRLPGSTKAFAFGIFKKCCHRKEQKTLKRVFFSYLKKIYIPPNAKNSTPPTNAMVGKTFARINAVVPFPLIFLCCLAKLIAFI